MVVNNAHDETAIVIRRDGHAAVVFVRLGAGKLNCERLTETQFRETWHESHYPLAETIERFLEHGNIHGCTQEALKGLTKLKERDQTVVANLF